MFPGSRGQQFDGKRKMLDQTAESVDRNHVEMCRADHRRSLQEERAGVVGMQGGRLDMLIRHVVRASGGQQAGARA